MNLEQMIVSLRIELQDVDKSLFTNDDALVRAVEKTVSLMSRVLPKRDLLEDTIAEAEVKSTYLLDISDILSDYIRIERVEYPVDSSPPQFPTFDVIGDYLSFRGDVGLVKDTDIRITFLGKWTPPALDTIGDYPSHLDDPVIIGSAGQALIFVAERYTKKTADTIDDIIEKINAMADLTPPSTSATPPTPPTLSTLTPPTAPSLGTLTPPTAPALTDLTPPTSPTLSVLTPPTAPKLTDLVKVICDAWTDCVPDDIGKVIEIDSTPIAGTLDAYDNALQTMWIKTDVTIADNDAITITSGSGEGTAVGAGVLVAPVPPTPYTVSKPSAPTLPTAPTAPTAPSINFGISGVATTGTTGTTLKDTTLSPFVASDVGKNVWNTTDGGRTTIAVYVSTSEVTLTADINLDSGDSYVFGHLRFTEVDAALGRLTTVTTGFFDIAKGYLTSGAALINVATRGADVGSVYADYSDQTLQAAQIALNLAVAELKKLEDTLAEYSSEAASYGSDVNAFANEMSGTVGKYRGEIDAEMLGINNYAAQVNKYQQEINEQAVQIALYEGEVRAYLAEITEDRDMLLGKYEGDIRAYQAQISEEALKIALYREEVQAYAGEINEESMKIALFQQEVNNYQTEIAEDRNMIEKYAQEVESYKTEIAKYQADVAVYTAQLNNSTGYAGQASAQVNGYLNVAGRYLASGQAKINEFLVALGVKIEFPMQKAAAEQRA